MWVWGHSVKEDDCEEMTLLIGWPTSEDRLALLITLQTKPEPFEARKAAAFQGRMGVVGSLDQEMNLSG